MPRVTQTELATLYNIKQNTISDILKNKDKWFLVNPDLEETNKQREKNVHFPFLYHKYLHIDIYATSCSTLTTQECFRGSKLNRSLGYKQHRALDGVLARQAVAAHATSAVLSEANVVAVGRHSVGARP